MCEKMTDYVIINAFFVHFIDENEHFYEETEGMRGGHQE